MNPVFILLVIIGAVSAWFLLSFAFLPLGRFVSGMFRDVLDIIFEEEREDEQ